MLPIAHPACVRRTVKTTFALSRVGWFSCCLHNRKACWPPFLNPAVYSAKKGYSMFKSLNNFGASRNTVLHFASDFFFAFFVVLIVCVISLLLSPRAHAQTSTGYKGGYQQQSTVTLAEVVSVRDVVLTGETSQTGQLVGQGIGGTLGALIGQTSKNYAITGIVSTFSTIAGGLIGSGIGSDQPAQEIILRMADSRTVSVTQSVSDGVRFSRGQPVMVIGNGRVAPL
jgi:outer membrane lipoprotein SlyB